jgi:hypothetical protein
VGVLIEQRQEDHHAFNDRCLDLVIQLHPRAVEPAFDGVKSMLPVGANRVRALAHGEGTVVGGEESFDVGPILVAISRVPSFSHRVHGARRRMS